MATYIFNGPSRENPTPRREGTSTGKNRIYQVHESTIELDELSLPSQDIPREEKVETIQSLRHPLIKINDYILSPGEILRMEIDSTGFLPEIKLKCQFVHKKFMTKDMPKDGDIISVAIRNKNNMLKIIRNDYVITNVSSGTNTTQMVGPTVMIFYGVLFIPWISSAKLSFSHNGTSLEALRRLSEQIGLGFATNEENTKDKQVWLSGSYPLSEFIARTTERAWKDDNSFYESWIDIYYNLNFVNINRMLTSSEDEVDVGAWLNNLDKDYTYGEDTSEESVIRTPKVLSNYEGYRTTSFYINTWKAINNSTQVTFDIGTKINCHLLEHNNKVYANPDARKYWKFEVEPTYDEDKINKYILLRGRATQIPTMRGNDLAQANYPFTEIYEYEPWLGVQYTASNTNENPSQWDGNQHRNYLRAKVQNLINNKELDKLIVKVNVNGLNTNFIKGDKVPIVLISKDVVENNIIDQGARGLDVLEQFFSGWYYIKGFNIKYTKENEGSIMSNFTQEFVLSRREWPPPIAVEALPQNENNT